MTPRGKSGLLGSGLLGSGLHEASVQIRVTGPREDCARDFGSSTAAAKIETFLAASVALDRETRALEAQLRTACAEARAPDTDRSATGVDDADPCEALVAWLEADPSRAGADAGPAPTCQGAREDFAACVSRCELRYRAQDVRVVIDEPSGRFTAPQASPRCRASCETLAAVAETCAAPEGAPALDRVGVIGLRAERIAAAAERLIEIAPVLPEAAATVSIRAVACVSSASEDVRGSERRLRALSAAAARVWQAAGRPSTPRSSFDGRSGPG